MSSFEEPGGDQEEVARSVTPTLTNRSTPPSSGQRRSTFDLRAGQSIVRMSPPAAMTLFSSEIQNSRSGPSTRASSEGMHTQSRIIASDGEVYSESDLQPTLVLPPIRQLNRGDFQLQDLEELTHLPGVVVANSQRYRDWSREDRNATHLSEGEALIQLHTRYESLLSAKEQVDDVVCSLAPQLYQAMTERRKLEREKSKLQSIMKELEHETGRYPGRIAVLEDENRALRHRLRVIWRADESVQQATAAQDDPEPNEKDTTQQEELTVLVNHNIELLESNSALQAENDELKSQMEQVVGFLAQARVREEDLTTELLHTTKTHRLSVDSLPTSRSPTSLEKELLVVTDATAASTIDEHRASWPSHLHQRFPARQFHDQHEGLDLGDLSTQDVKSDLPSPPPDWPLESKPHHEGQRHGVPDTAPPESALTDETSHDNIAEPTDTAEDPLDAAVSAGAGAAEAATRLSTDSELQGNLKLGGFGSFDKPLSDRSRPASGFRASTSFVQNHNSRPDLELNPESGLRVTLPAISSPNGPRDPFREVVVERDSQLAQKIFALLGISPDNTTSPNSDDNHVHRERLKALQQLESGGNERDDATNTEGRRHQNLATFRPVNGVESLDPDQDGHQHSESDKASPAAGRKDDDTLQPEQSLSSIGRNLIPDSPGSISWSTALATKFSFVAKMWESLMQTMILCLVWSWKITQKMNPCIILGIIFQWLSGVPCTLAACLPCFMHGSGSTPPRSCFSLFGIADSDLRPILRSLLTTVWYTCMVFFLLSTYMLKREWKDANSIRAREETLRWQQDSWAWEPAERLKWVIYGFLDQYATPCWEFT